MNDTRQTFINRGRTQIQSLHENDIIFKLKRHGKKIPYPRNRKFNIIIKSRASTYVDASDNEKSNILINIIDTLKSDNPPARFAMQHDELTDKECRCKTFEAMYHALWSYKQSQARNQRCTASSWTAAAASALSSQCATASTSSKCAPTSAPTALISLLQL
jgi:hypothetical protein